MRVTDQLLLDQSVSQVRQAQERLFASQRKASSGVQVENPSDDPAAFRRIDALSQQLVRVQGYDGNISRTRARLSAAEASLQSMQGIVTRFREVSLMALNTASDQGTVAVEAQQLRDQLLQGVNQSFDGEYLFSGYSQSAPFVGSRFVGDNQKRAVEISPLGATLFGVSAQEAFGVLPGQDVFTGISDAVTAIKSGDAAKIRAGLDAADQQLQRLSAAQAMIGAQMNTLDVAARANQDYRLALQTSLSDQRDINPAQAYSQLAADQHAAEATYSVIGSASRLSILKYL